MEGARGEPLLAPSSGAGEALFRGAVRKQSGSGLSGSAYGSFRKTWDKRYFEVAGGTGVGKDGVPSIAYWKDKKRASVTPPSRRWSLTGATLHRCPSNMMLVFKAGSAMAAPEAEPELAPGSEQPYIMQFTCVQPTRKRLLAIEAMVRALARTGLVLLGPPVGNKTADGTKLDSAEKRSRRLNAHHWTAQMWSLPPVDLDRVLTWHPWVRAPEPAALPSGEREAAESRGQQQLPRRIEGTVLAVLPAVAAEGQQAEAEGGGFVLEGGRSIFDVEIVDAIATADLAVAYPLEQPSGQPQPEPQPEPEPEPAVGGGLGTALLIPATAVAAAAGGAGGGERPLLVQGEAL